ncbi:hypothetical protein NKG94_43265 [Micromonospora sp. M12]
MAALSTSTPPSRTGTATVGVAGLPGAARRVHHRRGLPRPRPGRFLTDAVRRGRRRSYSPGDR